MVREDLNGFSSMTSARFQVRFRRVNYVYKGLLVLGQYLNVGVISYCFAQFFPPIINKLTYIEVNFLITVNVQ